MQEQQINEDIYWLLAIQLCLIYCTHSISALSYQSAVDATIGYSKKNNQNNHVRQ
jgi:hypothetical protein